MFRPASAHKLEIIMAEQIIRLPDVKARTGLSRSSIYAAISRGEFPSPLSLGARAVGWRLSDIEHWIDSRRPVGRGGPA
jgi:prophage regulatory protein